MEIDKANAQANPILLDMPAFLKVTPERTAKGDAALAREREGVTEWAMPKWSPGKGDSMEKFDQKFEDIVTALGYNTNIARGPNSRERILEIADDVGASTEFLKRFLGVETVEGTEEQIKDKAHVLLREQMGLPEVKGDKDMAAAKKATKKAAKTKAPKAAKEPKVKKAKTGDAPKKVGVIDEIVAMCQRAKGASVAEMVEHLTKKFPDRDADGMTTTIRIQVNRAPESRKLKVTKEKDEKRGLVYYFSGGK